MKMKRRKGLVLSGLFIAILVLVVLGLGTGSKQAETEAARVGAIAPNFTLTDLSGTALELKEIYRKNQLTLVNFWATWCPPCKREIPELVSFYRDYREQGLEILAVNAWDDSSLEQLRTFAEAAEMEFPILRDTKEEAVQKYGVRGVPTTIFIDGSGRIKEIYVGSLTYNQLRTRLERYLSDMD